MEKVAGHTAGPWDYFVGNADGRGLIRIEQHGTGQHIASMQRGAISEANAAFIVQAVNSHDELVAALKALDACYCEAADEMSRAQRDYHRKVLMQARNSLSRATKQEG